MLWRAFRPMRRADLSTALDTPLQLAGKIAGQGGKAARGGDLDGEKLVMSALDLGSYLSKIPVGPVMRRARRGYEQWQEGEGTPLSVIMPGQLGTQKSPRSVMERGLGCLCRLLLVHKQPEVEAVVVFFFFQQS